MDRRNFFKSGMIIGAAGITGAGVISSISYDKPDIIIPKELILGTDKVRQEEIKLKIEELTKKAMQMSFEESIPLEHEIVDLLDQITCRIQHEAYLCEVASCFYDDRKLNGKLVRRDNGADKPLYDYHRKNGIEYYRVMDSIRSRFESYGA